MRDWRARKKESAVALTVPSPPPPVEAPAPVEETQYQRRLRSAARAGAKGSAIAVLRRTLRKDPVDVFWHPYGRPEGMLLGTVEDIAPNGRITYRSPQGFTATVATIEGWVRMVPHRNEAPVASVPVERGGHHNPRRMAAVGA